MKRVVGIRFRQAGPIAYADAGDLEMRVKNYVVAQVEKGQEIAWVVREPKNLVWSQPDEESLLTVLRKATASDFGRRQ